MHQRVTCRSPSSELFKRFVRIASAYIQLRRRYRVRVYDSSLYFSRCCRRPRRRRCRGESILISIKKKQKQPGSDIVVYRLHVDAANRDSRITGCFVSCVRNGACEPDRTLVTGLFSFCLFFVAFVVRFDIFALISRCLVYLFSRLFSICFFFFQNFWADQ